jgi:hypothetical protein
MEVRLRQLLLHFCLDHLEEMSDRHLSLVALLVSLNFPRDLLQAVLGIRDSLVWIRTGTTNFLSLAFKML